MLGDELLQEVLVEAMQVLERIEDGETRPHAQEQRDLAQALLQVDDHGRTLRQPRQLHRRVDRDRRRPGTALGAEEDVGHAGLTGAGGCRLAPGRGAAHRTVERFFHRARRLGGPAGIPGKELVGAGAHRLEDQIGLGRRGDREDRHAVVPGAQPLDGREAGGGVVPDVDDVEIGRGVQAFDDADRNPAGAEQPRDLPFELFVVADDGRCKLCH